MLQALRLYLEKELGIMEFLLAYKHLAESQQAQQLPRTIVLVPLVPCFAMQLVFQIEVQKVMLWLRRCLRSDGVCKGVSHRGGCNLVEGAQSHRCSFLPLQQGPAEVHQGDDANHEWGHIAFAYANMHIVERLSAFCGNLSRLLQEPNAS